jgi:hypothetical protein
MARYPTYERIEGIIIQGVEFGKEVLHKKIEGGPKLEKLREDGSMMFFLGVKGEKEQWIVGY